MESNPVSMVKAFIKPDEVDSKESKTLDALTNPWTKRTLFLVSTLVTTTALIALAFLATSYITIPALATVAIATKITFVALSSLTVALTSSLLVSKLFNLTIRKVSQESIDDVEKDSLEMYTAHYHEPINNLLRTTEDPVKLDKNRKEKNINYVDKCNEITRAIHHLPKSNERLWRGAGYIPKTNYEELLKSKQTKNPCVVDRGFLSFTRSKKIAQQFLEANEQSFRGIRTSVSPLPILFRVKKGTAPGIEFLSRYFKEREHLYDHHKKFIVASINEKVAINKEKKFKYLKVDLEEVG